MSKSLRRVRDILEQAAIPHDIREMPVSTRTAQEAAAAIGGTAAQIAKSIVLAGTDSGRLALFVTSGANAVCPEAAAALMGEPAQMPGDHRIREVTGFAIGGVAPFGHLSPIRAWADPDLLAHAIVWAAAGTPRHMVALAPQDLVRLAQAQIAPFVRPALA